MTRKSLRAAQILWPAFVMAGVTEMLVFSVLDPSMLSFGGWHPEPTTVYSVAFFAFWALMSLAAAASQWMLAMEDKDDTRSADDAVRARRRRARHGVAQHV